MKLVYTSKIIVITMEMYTIEQKSAFSLVYRNLLDEFHMKC